MTDSRFIYALAVDASQKYHPFSLDGIAKAAEVTILGMLMIFSVLALLWGILAIFKLIFVGRTPKEATKKEKKAKAEKKAEKNAVAPEAPAEVAPTEAPATAPVAAPQSADDTELVAILTAAIAAYRENEGYIGADINGFRVVSFKRAGAGRAWNSKK